MRITTPLVLLILLFSVSTLHAQGKRSIANPIGDFLREYQDTAEVIDLYSRVIHKLEADFNNDGRRDIALTDPFTGGAQNLDWHFYLLDKDGTYRDIGSIEFEDILAIRPKRAGATRLSIYLHSSGAEGEIQEDALSFQGPKLLRRYSTTEGVEPLTGGVGPQAIPDSCCMVVDLLSDIHAPWSLRCGQ